MQQGSELLSLLFNQFLKKSLMSKTKIKQGIEDGDFIHLQMNYYLSQKINSIQNC